VIAYGRGGSTETVVPGETGLLFPEQSTESLTAAIRAFEAHQHRWLPGYIRLTTRRFGRERFQRELSDVVGRAYASMPHRASAHVPARRPIAAQVGG
jgi:hypothetical protein